MKNTIFQRFIGAKFHLNGFYLPNSLRNKGSERMVTKPPNMTLLYGVMLLWRDCAMLCDGGMFLQRDRATPWYYWRGTARRCVTAGCFRNRAMP